MGKEIFEKKEQKEQKEEEKRKPNLQGPFISRKEAIKFLENITKQL